MTIYLAHRPGVEVRDPFAGIALLPFLRRDARAACASADPEAWFLEQGEKYADDVFATCMHCPIRDACLKWALDNDEMWGVWGGTTPDDRRELKGQPRKYARRERVSTPVSCDHSDRDHYAHGMCEPCYRREKWQRKAHLTGECSQCHEDKRIYAIGLCGACYMRQHRAAS